MREKYLKIFDTYGINNQQRQLNEEVFELQEAIIKHENKNPITSAVDSLNRTFCTLNGKEYKVLSKEHIIEEIADVMVVLEQFIEHYNIDRFDIAKVMEQKVTRQLGRIAKGE